MAGRHTVQNGTVFQNLPLHSVAMRIRDIAPKIFLSVPCPTCLAAPGKRCLLHSGAPRSQPHVDRKLTAAKRVPCFGQYDRIDDFISFKLRGEKRPVFCQFLVDEFHSSAVFKCFNPLSSSRMFVACSRKLLNDGCGLFRAAGWLMQRIYRRQLGITHSEGLRSHSLGQLWCGKNGGSALRGGSAEWRR